MNYREYMQSELWKERRRAAIGRAKGKCETCGDTHGRLEVHHKTYERLGNEKPSDLIALCPACHWEADQQRKGVELSPETILPDYAFEPYDSHLGSREYWRFIPSVNRRQQNRPSK